MQKFSSVQPRLVIEQQSTVARSRCITSKFKKAIMLLVEKDAKVVMEELKRAPSLYIFQ